MNAARGRRSGAYELEAAPARGPAEIVEQIGRDNLARRARVWTAWFAFADGQGPEAVEQFLRQRAMSARVEGSSDLVVVEFHPTLAEAIVERALALGGVPWRSDSPVSGM